MLAVDLRVDRVVAGVDVERGVGRVAIFIRQARVVVDERVATVDADNAEGPGRVVAAALRVADVVAGRSRGVGHCADLVGHEDPGGGQDRRDRQEATKPVGHGAALLWRQVEVQSIRGSLTGRDSFTVG